MTKKKVNLIDPDCEPTGEDWDEIFSAANEKVRAETERVAHADKGRAKSARYVSPGCTSLWCFMLPIPSHHAN